MTPIDFFNQHPIFRYSEFKTAMAVAQGQMSEKNCQMTLYNYTKKNKLAHVRKGLYVVTSTISPLLIAAKATDDAVLSYHTALESYNLAYTDFNEHTFITARKTTSFLFQNQHYRPICNTNSSLIETTSLLGVPVRRTTLERTIVDVLDKPSLSGGWEEIMRSLELLTVFDLEKMVDYALALSKASIVAKLGYFLESRPKHFAIAPLQLERLLSNIPKQPYYIDRKTSIGHGVFIKKWQIIVPRYLYDRQWEESDHDIDI